MIITAIVVVSVYRVVMSFAKFEDKFLQKNSRTDNQQLQACAKQLREIVGKPFTFSLQEVGDITRRQEVQNLDSQVQQKSP